MVPAGGGAERPRPLALIAIGLAFCFRANVWNIGAEGQFVVGGLFGGWIAVATHGAEGNTLWVLPLMLAVGTLAGIAYALIPALLKVWLGVSEILTSLMLVYVAELLLDYMARRTLARPGGLQLSPERHLRRRGPPPLPDGGATRSMPVSLIALAAVIVAAIVLARTLFGFEVRVVGASPRAARFAGFSDVRLTLAVFAVSGGAAGLAGIAEVAG